MAIERRSADALSGPAQDHNLIDLYLKRYDSAQTRRAYRNDLEDFFGAPTVGLADIRTITFVHVNAYLEQLADDGYAASTVQRRIASLRGFFDWLVALEALDRNPAHPKLVRRVQKADKSDRSLIVLSSDQAEALLDATSAATDAAMRDYTLLYTLLHCVLRRSEAAGMDVAHLRPLSRYWVLDLPTTKGGANQYIKVPAHVVEQIDSMCAHYGIQQGPLWQSLSNNNRGGRLTPHSIYRIVRKTAEHAGLGDVGAHTLRHTGCTLALEAGASLKQVQTHARHKNIETTMMYIHQRDKLRDSAADYIHIRKGKQP